MMRRTKGFTLIELLVVIAIIGLLVSILVPSISQAQKLAKRAACSANLNGIGKALALYQSTYDDRWPLISNVNGMDYEAAFVRGGEDEVFDLDNAPNNEGTSLNVNENLCLLVKANMVTSWKMFRCPQFSSEVMDRSDNGDYGFSDDDGKIYLDYAYHNGYSETDIRNAAPFSGNLVGNFAILADQPGEDLHEFGDNTGNDGEGYNHDDDGVAVLYAGTNVQWNTKTLKVGWGKNNIYAVDMSEDNDNVGNGTSPGTPENKHDSVLIDPTPP